MNDNIRNFIESMNLDALDVNENPTRKGSLIGKVFPVVDDAVDDAVDRFKNLSTIERSIASCMTQRILSANVKYLTQSEDGETISLSADDLEIIVWQAILTSGLTFEKIMREISGRD